MTYTPENLSSAKRNFNFHFGIHDHVMKVQAHYLMFLGKGTVVPVDPLMGLLQQLLYHQYLPEDKEKEIKDSLRDAVDCDSSSFQCETKSTIWFDVMFYDLPDKDPFGNGSFMLERLFDPNSHGPFADGYHLQVLFDGITPLVGVEFIDGYHIDLLHERFRDDSATSYDLEALFDENVLTSECISKKATSDYLIIEPVAEMKQLSLGILICLIFFSWGNQLLRVMFELKKSDKRNISTHWSGPIEFVQSLFKQPS